MEKKELEAKFSEFLIQKIKHAGGSLPLQLLYGILQYATFEIRKEFGTTKLTLMKFLKAHSEIFSIDLSGMVTVTSNDPGVSDDSDHDEEEEVENGGDDNIYNERSTETVIKYIENGFGTVVKLHPEFGIIKAIEPIETEVYFKPDVFSGYQDKLLTDTCLEIGYEVLFNADYGYDALDIKFRATKVWLKMEKNVNCDDISIKEKALSNLEGDGVIQKIISNMGFISVSGKEKETVFFTKNSVIDCNGIELAKFFNVGDTVSFSARRSNEKNSKWQWQATVVKKKLKEKIQSTSHTKFKANVQNRIENEPGKIYPHSHGAVIKFRKNELADGDSTKYFYYGIEVSDISWEFSEGDDVCFDAIKTKSAPGWKALYAWVGEKPEFVNTKVYSYEDVHNISDKTSTSCQKNNSTVSLKSKPLESKCDTTQQIQSKKMVCDYVVDKNTFEFESECKRQNLKSHGSIKTFPSEKSNKRGTKPRKEIFSKKKNSRNNNTSESQVMHKQPKNSTVNRLKRTKLVSNMEMDDTSSHSDKYYDDGLSDQDEGSDISERSFHNMLQGDEDISNEEYKSFESEHENDSVHYDESEINNADNEIKHHKSSVKRKPSIKTFQDIDGEVIILYCKAAIVRSSELQRDTNFLLNVFYIDGKSVEEQQVIDLKEIIKVGDHVKINCFEIIDDFGEIHQKVTLAWKGPKPNVYEMTPKEFIDESELCVTLSDELISECVLDERKASLNSPEEIPVIKHHPADADRKNFEEKNLLIDTHKLLSEKIVHGLRSKGLISADLKIDFSDMLTQIISLTEKHRDVNSYKSDSLNVEQVVCSTCGKKTSSIFCGQNKSEKHTAAQTIITGGIIAQSIYTQN